MGCGATDIEQVRRWTAEPTGSSSFTDPELAVIIERYPVTDAHGEDPTLGEWDEGYNPVSGSGSGSAGDVNPAWTPTYDLHLAAADVWDTKAAGNAAKFSFGADGATYDRNQVYQACKEQAAIQRSLSDADADQPRMASSSSSSVEASIAFEDWESGIDV